MTTLNGATPIIIAGHSHVGALIGGREWEGILSPVGIGNADREVTDEGGPLIPIEGHERVFGLRGSWPRTDAYWDELVDNAAGKSIALVWAGNYYNALFMVEQPIPFDFVPRTLQRLPVNENAVIIPEALVRARLSAEMRAEMAGAIVEAKGGATEKIQLLGVQPVLDRIKRQPDARVAMVGPPPPQVLPSECLGHRITPSVIRLKLWQVETELLREEAEQAGIDFITAPDLVRDEDGYLKPELGSGDGTHANTAYGQIMLDELKKRL